MDLNEKIKMLREQHRLTLEDVAKFVGVSIPTVQRWETGEIKNLRRDKIYNLAKILKTTPAYLMGWEENDKVAQTAATYQVFSNIVKTPSKKFPIIGSIPAGTPILADENIDDYISFEDDIDADFCLRVQGDSMKDANINEGDIVFLKSQDYVSDGKIHAVLKEDGDTYDTVATLKRVYQQNGGLMLVPANEEYRPEFWSGDKVRVIGKVVYCLSKVK